MLRSCNCSHRRIQHGGGGRGCIIVFAQVLDVTLLRTHAPCYATAFAHMLVYRWGRCGVRARRFQVTQLLLLTHADMRTAIVQGCLMVSICSCRIWSPDFLHRTFAFVRTAAHMTSLAPRCVFFHICYVILCQFSNGAI